MKTMVTWTLLVLVLGAGWASAAVITVDAGGGADHENLAPAIAAALPGDVITVADGTYVQTAQLNVDKALTIQGASEAGVIIDCSAVAGYGFSVYASDVTMENMTILPPTPNYPIHASGTSNPPDGFLNLTLSHITIVGTHQRAGFDIHGYTNVALSFLTSGDATGGNGLQLTGCIDVTANNITTFNNAWGSIAIYCSNTTLLNRGCSNVVIDGATLSVGEDAVFIQDEFGLASTGVTVTGYDFHVRNSRFREPATDSEGYTFLRDDLAAATAFALALPFPEASTILDLVSGQYVVVPGMSIQAAIDAAADGGVVQVADGTYAESLDIFKPLSLIGQSEIGVIIDASTFDDYSIDAMGDFAFAFSDFTLIGNPVFATAYGLKVAGDGATCDVRRVTIQNCYRTGLDFNGLDGGLVEDCTVTGTVYGVGLGMTDCSNITISGLTTSGNAWAGVGIYADGSYFTGGSDNVALTGVNSLGENLPLYTEESGGFAVTNLQVSVADFAALSGNNLTPGALGYFPNVAIAQLGVLATDPVNGWVVDRTDGSYAVADGMSVQAAITAASAGDLINVGAGSYEEQLHIATDDLTVTGAGVGATFVNAPADMPLFFTTSADNYPIVFVDGAAGTALSGMTIDGQGNGALNYRFIGLGLHNADGGYSDLYVTGVRNEPLDGAQHGVGLYVINDDAAPRTVSFTDVSVDDTQKNATVFDGVGLSVAALRLSCTGNGPLGVGLPAQNGVQVSGGAYTSLTDCSFADYDYTDPSWTATGLLVFGPGSADMTGGSITSCRTSVYYFDASGTVDGITVTNPQGDPLYAYASAAAKAAGRTPVQPQRFDPAPTGNPNKASSTFVLLNSTFTGNDVVDSWGPTAWAEGDVDFTVQGCTIEHFDNGLNLYESGGTVTGSASGNVIRNNLTFGGWSNTVLPFDARNNDWGDISGPYHPTLNPTGLGNAVSDNILFEPWTGQAGLGVIPVASGPLTCGQTLELTIQYTADEATPDMFLYNVVVRIPPQLFFNTVRDEHPFGTVNNNFFVVDNLDGTWTFTGSTVGNPMSPVVGPGTFDLFTIVAQTATDGLGDVVIEDYALRDPANAPIPAGLSGATVLVDCTAPAAVAGIAAAPGHMRVDVSWSHDGTDVDHYEVFVGMWEDGSGGSAYPEYDDLATDVIPARPANYAAAVASPQWVSLGNLAVTELTQTWTDATERGVFYYEVFAIDTAGNASAPAAANDRSSNYWLGDVYGNSAGDYVGNGLVNVRDVNYLAASYGDPVPTGHPDGVLDVGPTDDMSRVGIPLTDSVLNFEDLMIFSMNFGVVAPATDRAPVGSSRVALAWVDYGEGRYGLRLSEGSALKGLRVTGNVGVTGVEGGTLLDEQSELTFAANVGDRLDASVAVMGQNVAFTGVGDLLVISGAAAIDVADLAITARGTDNSDLEVTIDMTSGTLAPRVFAVYPNYPNPFNPMTKISFSLPESQDVRLVIYSVDGRLVRTLVNEVRGPGLHEVIWNGQDDTGRQAASGVYFYRVDAGPHSEVRKMTLMK